MNVNFRLFRLQDFFCIVCWNQSCYITEGRFFGLVRKSLMYTTLNSKLETLNVIPYLYLLQGHLEWNL
jgi:hypothetical protein